MPKVFPSDAKDLGQAISQPGELQPGTLHSSTWNDQSIDPHRWMECMKAFSEEFRQIIGKLRKSRKPRDLSTPEPVVVALIDDGDTTH